jgi:hypothetical protein
LDPDWNLYRSVLAPGPYDLQRILNRRLLDFREKQGDRADLPREIDHFAYFPSQAQAQRAAAALRDAGFTTDDLGPPRDDGAQWELSFHRVDSIGNDRADEFVTEVLEVILPLDGRYDGWGAVIL